MSTSSADAVALHHYSLGLAGRADTLAQAAATATRALRAYEAACPDVPVTGSLLLTAPMRAERAASLAGDVRLVMEAFASADRGSGPPTLGTAEMPDLLLSLHLARHAPGLATGALLGPIHARTAEGREAGLALAAHADDLKEGREAAVSQAATVLEGLAADDVRDPTFAAGFLNQLDAETVELLTAGLLRHRYGSPDDLPVALRNLQVLLRRAGETDGGSFQGEHLSTDLLADLTAEPTGRQTLRFLLWGGIHASPTPPELVRRVQHALLVDSSALLDGRQPVCEVSRYLDRHRIDLDAHALAAIAGDLDLVNGLLADPDHIARIRANLSPEVRPAMALVVAAHLDHLTHEAHRRLALHHEGQVSTGSAAATARADAAIRRYVATLAADPAGAATEELVLVADGMRFHMEYYLDPGPETRSDGAGPRREVDALLPAFAQDRAALVYLLATIDGWEREVLDRHFTDADSESHRTAVQIEHIDHFQARLHAAAEEADVPDDDWAFAVGIARGLVDHGAAALAVKTKGVSILAGKGAQRGLDHIHEQLKGDPSDHADVAEAQQARRRTNAWSALAQSEMGAQLRWGPEGTVGLDDLAELIALDPGNPDDHQRLSRWIEAQPEDLRRRVEEAVGT